MKNEHYFFQSESDMDLLLIFQMDFLVSKKPKNIQHQSDFWDSEKKQNTMSDTIIWDLTEKYFAITGLIKY